MKKRTKATTTMTGKIGNIPITVTFGAAGLLISPKGYGDKCSKDGEGCPILITNQVHGKSLEVIIWSNINEEDPTHFVKLDGAKEKNRISP